MKKKIYNSFQDKYGNEYNFDNYMSFAKFWFSLYYRDKIKFFPDNYKKLQYMASDSKEARTPAY